MYHPEIADPLFRQAVDYIDTGNEAALQQLLETNPELVAKRLDSPEGGYFKDPYLLWFVADNPIRHEKLPANIAAIARLIIGYMKIHAKDSFQNQIGYALGLVVTGRIPKECGVQIELMDLLMDEGAIPGNGHGAIAQYNLDAARRLIEKGGELTLATAICLGNKEDIDRLLQSASTTDKQIALMAASFYGNADMIKLLIEAGADVNAYIDRSSGFHSHASALHQAIYSGSLEAVKTLIDAGADLHAIDRIYEGTPLGWAQHIQTEVPDEAKRKQYAEIEMLLKQRLS
jgi:hypothetical protein